MTDGLRLQEIIGDELMERVCQELGGASVYIPTHPHDHDRDSRLVYAYVEQRRSGATCMSAYQTTADEFGLSRRRVRQIVSGAITARA